LDSFLNFFILTGFTGLIGIFFIPLFPEEKEEKIPINLVNPVKIKSF